MSIRVIEMDFEGNIGVATSTVPEVKTGLPRRVDLSQFKESKELAGDTSWILQMKGFNRKREFRGI